MNRLVTTECLAIAVLVPLLLLSALASEAEERRPVRVATLLPFVADALRLASEQARVVANVRRSLHAPLSDDVIDLGNPHSPDFERLAEARADLIVGDQRVHAAIAPRLAALGAEVELIDTTGVDGTLDALATLGERIGGSEALGRRIASVRARIAGVGRSIDADVGAEVGVLALFGAPGTFYAVTERSWLGQLTRTLGLRNLAPSDGDERFPGLVPLSDEVVSTLEPDLVVLVAHGDPRKIRADLASKTAAGGAWASLAGAERGIHVLDPTLFSANPGLDLARAAEVLASLVRDPATADGPGPTAAAAAAVGAGPR